MNQKILSDCLRVGHKTSCGSIIYYAKGILPTRHGILASLGCGWVNLFLIKNDYLILSSSCLKHSQKHCSLDMIPTACNFWGPSQTQLIEFLMRFGTMYMVKKAAKVHIVYNLCFSKWHIIKSCIKNVNILVFQVFQIIYNSKLSKSCMNKIQKKTFQTRRINIFILWIQTPLFLV